MRPGIGGRAASAFATVVLAVTTLAGCRSVGRDLRVTNDWVRPVTVEVSAAGASGISPSREPRVLGQVSPGETVTFAAALGADENWYLVHLRLPGGAEFRTLCLTRESIARPGWALLVASTGSTCPAATPAAESRPPG